MLGPHGTATFGLHCSHLSATVRFDFPNELLSCAQVVEVQDEGTELGCGMGFLSLISFPAGAGLCGSAVEKLPSGADGVGETCECLHVSPFL